MLKQSPSRNQRPKGFKIKHVLQIFVLLAIGIWLLNQFRCSYNKANTPGESTAKISENLLSKQGDIELGRKGLHPRVEDSSSGEEDMEQAKPEDMEDEERGDDGDDIETDGHDQERAEEEESEEVEDLIDVEDRQREEGTGTIEPREEKRP